MSGVSWMDDPVLLWFMKVQNDHGAEFSRKGGQSAIVLYY